MTYRSADFQACLNQAFVLEAGEIRDELELIEVDVRGNAQASGERETFSIIFLSRNPDPLPQQIYHLTNSQLGELDLFIVPIGKNDEGVSYEAVFS